MKASISQVPLVWGMKLVPPCGGLWYDRRALVAAAAWYLIVSEFNGYD